MLCIVHLAWFIPVFFGCKLQHYLANVLHESLLYLCASNIACIKVTPHGKLLEIERSLPGTYRANQALGETSGIVDMGDMKMWNTIGDPADLFRYLCTTRKLMVPCSTPRLNRCSF
jgi:hypothetical protein